MLQSMETSTIKIEATQNIFRKTAWGLLAIPVTQKALGSMTESLKMWRILSNKTNAFNKHVQCNKNIYLTVLHVM